MTFDAVMASTFEPDEIPDGFWDVIRQSAGSREVLRSILMQASQSEIIAFARNFTEAASQLKDEPFYDFIGSDESEDGMDDIADWVVSQGKEAYVQVWRHPETIPRHIDVGDPTNLHFVAESVYHKRFGEMPDPD